MTNKMGFPFGSSVRFLQPHDRDSCNGIVLGQTSGAMIENERQYFVLYRGTDGEPRFDRFVAECWLERHDGYIDPQNAENLQTLTQRLIAEHIPEGHSQTD